MHLSLRLFISPRSELQVTLAETPSLATAVQTLFSKRRRLSDGTKGSLPLWHVVRHLPNFQRVTIAQFLSRATAEAHLQFLGRMFPGASYAIVFDQLSSDKILLKGKNKDARYQNF